MCSYLHSREGKGVERRQLCRVCLRVPVIIQVIVKNVFTYQDLNPSSVNGDNYSYFIAWTKGLNEIVDATCLWAHFELLLNSCFYNYS